MQHLLTLFQSRKFWLSIIGLISVVYVTYTGNEPLPDQQLVDAIVTIVAVLVASFGAVDVAERLR